MLFSCPFPGPRSRPHSPCGLLPAPDTQQPPREPQRGVQRPVDDYNRRCQKAIIADYIAQYNDLIFANPGGYSGFESLMGIIGYTMQIYCDFSGYSDMAIGIALIMGFKLAPNFNFPYKAHNLTDFWHRWHISLSTWLRDYIYIPLGGNRKGTARTYINSFTTMLIGGLWHGAAWKFVFWGAMHGAGLAVHKAARPRLSKIP